MNTLAHTRNCTECGSPVDHGATLGLCPVCALRAAMNLQGAAGKFDFKEPAPATIRGDYDLLEEVGRGGMGVVFRARQKSLDRIVALKVLSGGVFADPSGKKRLLSEAAAAARLRHPNIVAVHEAGELDGQPFYSMDFIAGRTLAEIARTGPVQPGRAARWLQKIAGAVHYAHLQGVLHRDLKPSNVLLDENDEPRIADFGLAKILDSPEAVTVSGSIFGSPAYMPPERAAGRVSEMGPAGDVYSLGALLYELLTGRPPFQGASPQAVIEQVKANEPVPLRRMNADVPVDLETVTLKCLEKNPAQRYASAQELADELQRFLDGRPVLTRPVGPAEKIWRWSRRRPLLAMFGVTSAMLLLAFVAVLAVSAARIRESRDEAQARLADALFSEAKALRMAGNPGWRAAGLGRLTEARRLDTGGRLTSRLRNEAIAALSRPDLLRHLITNLPPTPDTMLVCFDRAFERIALWNASNRTVAIHRVADGRELVSWKTGQPDELREFSADGKFICLRHGGRMSVWNAATGDCVLPGTGSESHRRFNGGAFSPDGARFGRGETGGRFCGYDLAASPPTLAQAWTTPGAMPVGTAAWSADARNIALVLSNATLAVCDAETGRVHWRRDFARQIWNVAWNNARGLIAVQSGNERVLLLAPEDGETVQHLNLTTDGSSCAVISPDGSRLAAACDGFGTRWFNPPWGQFLIGDSADAWHLHFDSGGNKLGTLLDDNHPLWLEWSPPLLPSAHPSPAPPTYDQRVAFSPDGRWLASLSSEGVFLWDAAAEEIVARLALTSPILGGFDHAGKRLFVVQDRTLFQVEVSVEKGGGFGAPVPVLQAGVLGRPSMSAEGMVAVPDKTRQAVIVLHGTNQIEFAAAGYPARPVFSVDGRWLACSLSLPGEEMRIYDVRQPQLAPVRLPPPRTTPIFTPDGEWLLTFDREAQMRRVGSWDAGPSLPLNGVDMDDFIAEISLDGRWLAATQHKREIHLIDLPGRKTVAVLDVPGEGRVFDLAFSPDGNTLVVARDMGVVQFWNLPQLREELARFGLDW